MHSHAVLGMCYVQASKLLKCHPDKCKSSVSFGGVNVWKTNTPRLMASCTYIHWYYWAKGDARQMNLEKNTEILLESFLDTNGKYKLLSQLRKKKLVQLLKSSLYNISKGGHCHTLTAEELDKSKLFTNSNTPPVVRVIPTGTKK